MTFIKNFLNDEAGASAAEYALILAVVGVAIGGAALVLGQAVGDAIVTAGNNVDNCGDAAASGVAGNCTAPAGSTVD
jgi:pilus assembly protein Flp/PilA